MLLIIVWQAIGGLKRQLLELLNDAGFVTNAGAAPLRARAVEALGRRVELQKLVSGDDPVLRVPRVPIAAEVHTRVVDLC